MISEFQTWLRLGASHIADLNGADHILFLVALTAAYSVREWKPLLVLITAFTVGHTLTLGLATTTWVRVPGGLVEFLIALSIVVTALVSLAGRRRGGGGDDQRLRYGLAGVFGLIHGLGFSTFLRSVLGAEERLVLPLLAFNVGLEAGQVLIVLLVLVAGWLLCDIGGVKREWWGRSLALIALVAGVRMMWGRIPW